MGVERVRIVAAIERQVGEGIGTPECIGIPTHGSVLRIAYTAGTAIRHTGQLLVADCRTFDARSDVAN